MRLLILFLVFHFFTFGCILESQAAQASSFQTNPQYETSENHFSAEKQISKKKKRRKGLKLGWGDWALIVGGIIGALYFIPAFVGGTVFLILLNLSSLGITLGLVGIFAGKNKRQKWKAFFGLLISALPLIGLILELAMVIGDLISREFFVWLPKYFLMV